MSFNRCLARFSLAASLGLVAPASLAQKAETKKSVAKPAETKKSETKKSGAKQDGEAAQAAPDESTTEPKSDPPAKPAEAAADGSAPEKHPAGDSGDSASAGAQGEGMADYQAALQKRRLAATTPLSRQRLREELTKIEAKLLDGRRDEAIGDLVYLIESPRFPPFAQSEEGKAATYWLGDSLGRAGAYTPARGYLASLLKGDPKDTWYRRAVRSLVELGLESGRPRSFLKDLESVGSTAPEELTSDIAYLRGREAELSGNRRAALAAYAKVSERSRFWAQATYLSGLIEVERGKLKRGEQLFCKVADPKRTPRRAPLFGGSDFFRVRDLARLGLGRIAHEQYRFDDSRYYYYLVPKDSEHLPEALYESATSRYEKKDYDGARELMDELNSLKQNHPYEDEAWILDAYIDLASCRFFKADAKLKKFLSRYDPTRDAARRIAKDPAALSKLVEAVRSGQDPAGAGLGVKADVARTLGALIRLDGTYSVAARRLAQLDHQLRGLRGAMGELDEAQRRLAAPKGMRPQAATALGDSSWEKVERLRAQIAEVRRLARDAARAGKQARLAPLEKELEALELQVRAAEAAAPKPSAAETKNSTDRELAKVISDDRQRATLYYEQAQQLRKQVEAEQLRLAKDALVRLDRRLSRLLRRARLGRIETVLGQKRALEVEVEALSQGLLPRTIVDSLDAQRFLQDDEEYWPYDGEDWEDEYVGGEGLR